MERRNFFKKAAVGLVTGVAAAKVLATEDDQSPAPEITVMSLCDYTGRHVGFGIGKDGRLWIREVGDKWRRL